MTDIRLQELHEAAKKGNVEVCKRLIDEGVPVNGRIEFFFSFDTALSHAAYKGHIEVVDLLLNRGASVDGTVDDFVTPLFSACIGGHLSVVRRLLESGADLHRESLKQPLTPTGVAEYWSFQKQGQAEVAQYLRSIGGINPYWDLPAHAKDPNDRWTGSTGEMQIELLERGLYGRVSLVSFVREINSDYKLVVRQCRYSAQKFLFRMLCTVNLAQVASVELAIALPATWPLHTTALQQQQYAWPLELIFHVAKKLQQGACLKHGDALNRDGEILHDIFTPNDIEQWIVVAHNIFEDRRISVPQAGLAQTLLLVPNPAKSLKSSDAKAKADAKAKVKWEKRALGTSRNSLVVPTKENRDEST